MSVNRKKRRMGVADSLKTNIPIKTVPTAPIPVKWRMPFPKVKSEPPWQAWSYSIPWKPRSRYPTDKKQVLTLLSFYPSRM